MKQAMQSLLALVNKYVKDHADRLGGPTHKGGTERWSWRYLVHQLHLG